MSYSARCPQCGVRVEIEPEEIRRNKTCHECDYVFESPVTGIMAGVTTDGFWVKKRLAGGAVSEIFEAQKMATSEKLLLKVLCPSMTRDPAAVDAYMAWVERAREVNLPNVVASLETGTIMDHIYLAYPTMSGICLDAHLESEGPMAEKEALKVGMKIARILDTAWTDHAALHLSLKPSNILLDMDKQIFLLDPGHCRLLLPLEDPELQRLSGWPPYYFAPELILGQTDLDHRSDMYSLGATLYELATGEPIYEGEDVADIFGRHLEEMPEAPSTHNDALSKRFDSVVMTLLAKNRDDRYATWEEAAKALKHATKSKGKSTTATRLNLKAPDQDPTATTTLKTGGLAAVAAPEPESKNRAIIIGGIVLAAFLAVVAVVLWMSQERVQPDTPQQETQVPAVDPKMQELEQMYSAAMKYAEENPQDFDGAIRRFVEVRTAGNRTDYQHKAQEQISAIRDARKAAEAGNNGS